MIMTKDKVRELNAMTTGRANGGDVLPEDGSYDIAATQDAFEMRKLAENGGAEYFVMGMIVPAHKAAAVCQLLQDDQGLMPSPIIMLKKQSRGSGTSTLRPSTLTSSGRPMSVTKEVESTHDESVIRIKNIEIIPGRHEVKVSGKPVVLTFSEFRILQTLATKPGWVFSREQIIHAVHGSDYNCTERAVDVQVTGLRKKIGEAGDHIETVRGVGYRFGE